ncbi:Speckle-type POZ protein A-like isoform X2 [Aphelenchoides besseyi]|nr:Speckle-type POZ protein A-like isoform X2 [Aphelenchoides besseyi]
MALEYEKPVVIKWDIGIIFPGMKYECSNFGFKDSLGANLKVSFSYCFSDVCLWSLTACDWSPSFQFQQRAWLQYQSNQKIFLQKDWSETYAFTQDKREIICDKKMYNCLPNHHYTLCVEIRKVVQKVVRFERKLKIMSAMANCFDNPKYSDAEINVRNLRSFKVHKVVLCTQSDVFAAMFEHECKEKNSNVISINNADVEVVEGMLRYLYSGEVENIGELAPRLLVLADQYQVNELTDLCMEGLKENFTIDNAIERLRLLEYAERLTAFKKPLFEFVKENFDLISELPEWLSFAREHAEIVTQLISFFVSKSK